MYGTRQGIKAGKIRHTESRDHPYVIRVTVGLVRDLSKYILTVLTDEFRGVVEYVVYPLPARV